MRRGSSEVIAEGTESVPVICRCSHPGVGVGNSSLPKERLDKHW